MVRHAGLECGGAGRRGGARAIVLILIGAVGTLVLVCCGGGALVLHLGMGEFAHQVQADLTDNPVIVEHIGEIESFTIKYGASFLEEGEDVFVFRIRGTKGAGTVTAECVSVSDDEEDVVSGTLELAGGETFDLFPAPPEP